MKPRIMAYSDAYSEWLNPFEFIPFWGCYTIQGNFKYWTANKNINLSPDEQYKQNKANHTNFVISESIESLLSRASIQ